MKRFKEWFLINDKKFTIDEVLGAVDIKKGRNRILVACHR